MSRGAAALVPALVALIGLVAPSAARGPAPDVVVATTGDRSELHDTVPVTREPRAQPMVAMSLKPARMPSLQQGDLLRITAELQTTNNCYRRTHLCISHPPYSYSPRIGTQLVLARRSDATAGPGTVPITSRHERDCDQQVGNRQHHCVTVYRGTTFRIGDPAELPCRLERCRINLVVDAHNPHARPRDLVALGIDRPGGKVSGDRSRLNAVRLRGIGFDVQRQSTNRRLSHRVPVKEGPKHTILSLRLPNLEAGQQLTFSAFATVDIHKLHYASFTGSQLVLARHPKAVGTSDLTREAGSLNGEITEANGFNCTQKTTPCTIRRVGTLVMEKTPVRNGHTVPLYANLVLRNAPKEVPDTLRDYMGIRRGGIDGRRYR